MSTSEAPRPISLQDMLTLLQEGALELRGLLPDGSNYTFLVTVGDGTQKTLAVYKPTRGERPLWDFPAETLALREVAAFLVSEVLGWNFVPPTVYRPEGPHGPGSVQFFVHAQSESHYFNLAEADHSELQRIALFDLMVNNADRKGGHVLKDEAGKLWAIDHGICFHAQPKLRTVIWDFAGQSIAQSLLDDMADFRQRLETDKDLKTAINSLLTPLEVSALRRRTDKLITAGRYPDPGPGRNYPWPPL